MNKEENRIDGQVEETAMPENTLPTETLSEAVDTGRPEEEKTEPAAEQAGSTQEETPVTVQVDGKELTVDELLADLREVTESDAGLHLIPAEEPKESPLAQAASPAGEAEPAEETVPPVKAEEKSAEPVEEPTVKLNPEEYLIDTPAYMGLEGSMPKKKRRKRHAHFLYYIAEALRGMKAHGFMSFAAIGIITACLLLMGCFAMVVLNLNNMLNNLMDRNEFLAYVEESYTQDEAMALQREIEAIENVAQVQFITREEAKASYIEGLDDDELYADLPDYIFRDRFSVHVEDLNLIEDTIERVQQVEGIVDISVEMKVAKGFVTIRNIAMIVAAAMVLILFTISMFIMSNTIKLATINRGDEIAIMRMCGATNRFIRWPFIYEGMILGLLGSGIAYGLLTGIYYLIVRALNLSGKISLITIIPYQDVSTYVLIVFLVAGLIIGVGGSSGTIRKFLKV